MNDFLNFFGDAVNNLWGACKWIAPALAIDVWLKQDRVDQRLAKLEELHGKYKKKWMNEAIICNGLSITNHWGDFWEL